VLGVDIVEGFCELVGEVDIDGVICELGLDEFIVLGEVDGPALD
jgi:hypothetical protein